MPDRELITRDDLRRALAVNALTRPLNVAVPAAVAVAAALLGAGWLFAVAAVCYVALAVTTFFDERVARRVGRRVYGRDERRAADVDPATFAEPIRERVEAALEAQALIEDTVADADVALEEVPDEVDDLVTAMTVIAARADRVHHYLETRDADALRRRIATLRSVAAADDTQLRTLAALQDQLRSIDRLRENLDRFLGEMDHLVASLEAMHAQVVTMSTAQEDVVRDDVATQVRHLREQVSVMSDGVEEAFAETRSGLSSPARWGAPGSR